VASTSDNAPIEFVVPGHGDDCIDLPHAMLHIRAKINKTDGSNLTSADKKIGPVNDFLSAMFSEVQIYLNNQLISYSSNTYTFRSCIEKLLNYNANAITTHLQTAMWFKDTASYMDSVADNNNQGFKILISNIIRIKQAVDIMYIEVHHTKKDMVLVAF